MLGLALRVLLATAAVAAVVAIVIYVTGTITKTKLKEELQKNGINDALIEAIDRCDNVVSVNDLDSDKTLEIHGDEVSRSLNEGDRIHV